MNEGKEVMEVVGDVKYEMAIDRDPKQVLAEAMVAAKALKDVISLKSKPVIFNGEQYLEFEDWQTVAKFYGVTARVISTEYVDIGGAKGFLARADAVLIKTGMVISGAEAMCLNDEEKWTSRTKYEWKEGKKIKVGEVPVPMFQLRSMAQTRACAKALKNVLAWVVVLAGYNATPAEDMTGSENASPPVTPKPAGPKEAPKAATSSTKQSNDGLLTAIGHIKEMSEANKGGYVKTFVDGYVNEHGYDIGFSTKDQTILDTLLAHMNKGEKVSFTYSTVKDGKYTNYNIVELVSVQEPIAQPGD